MKTFVLYACVFSFIFFISGKTVFSAGNGKLLVTQSDFDECLRSTNVTSDELFSVFDVLEDKNKEPKNKERLIKQGCVFQCALEKMGMMKGSEVILEKLNDEVRGKVGQYQNAIIETFNTCVNATKHITEKCEKTFELIMCIFQTLFKEISRNNEERACENEHTTLKSE